MDRVVGNTLRVCNIGSQRQITVQRLLGAGPRNVDHGGVLPLYLGGDTGHINGLGGSILLGKDIDTLKVGRGLGDARIRRNRVICGSEGGTEEVGANGFEGEVERSLALCTAADLN
jgi:hypothetical protein